MGWRGVAGWRCWGGGDARDERRRILPMHVHVHLSSIAGPRVPIRTAGFGGFGGFLSVLSVAIGRR